MRAASLEVFHHLADGHLRFDRDRKMDMRGSPSDAVQENALRPLAATCEQFVDNLLNRRYENGRIVLCVPVEMQKDLVIDMR
jgi:hypothetical protein